MPSEACVARERRAGRHEPERSKWAECVIKGGGDHVQMLTSLFSMATVRPMRSGESGGKDNRLCAASTPALLATTNDQRSNLGICRADQCSNTERSAYLGRADHEMRGSDLSSINRVVVRRLHRIDN